MLACQGACYPPCYIRPVTPPMTANKTHNQAGCRRTENRACLKNALSLWAEDDTLLLELVWLENKNTLDRNTKLKSNMQIQKTIHDGFGNLHAVWHE